MVFNALIDSLAVILSTHVVMSLIPGWDKVLLKCFSSIYSHETVNQSGFRPGKGTREGILNLRIIIQRYTEVQKPVYICFIDYEKAFDRVYHDRIMQCLDHIDMDCNDKRG